MSENCNQQCSSCSQECDERKGSNPFLVETNELSNVKKVIGVVSGKGGVGKSIVTSMLASEMKKRGHRTAILDADITGPSIPKAFGLKERALAMETKILPVKSGLGIDIMSLNLLMENDTDPVIWRGPIIAETVKQFWSEVVWGDVDYMFVDMPPGTGDVPLTVFQSLPLAGIVIVTSPQELVSMIVEKAVHMAEKMNIPILGLVENMSYFKCSDCGKEISVFGQSKIEDIASRHNIDAFVKIPMEPLLAKACDNGKIEEVDAKWLTKIITKIEKNQEDIKMKIAVASEGTMVTGHFGHCENFNIYDVEDKKIVKSESVSNPGHKPGFLPNFLNDLGVNVIISGGMGGGAIDIFNEKGIQVIIGTSGDAKENVQAFLEGKLESTGSVCHEYEHADECGN